VTLNLFLQSRLKVAGRSKRILAEIRQHDSTRYLFANTKGSRYHMQRLGLPTPVS
jgi:hypothetical protein